MGRFLKLISDSKGHDSERTVANRLKTAFRDFQIKDCV